MTISRILNGLSTPISSTVTPVVKSEHSHSIILLVLVTLAFSSTNAIAQSECLSFDTDLLNRYTFDNGQAIDEAGVQHATSTGLSQASGQLNSAVSVTADSDISLGNYDPDLTRGVTMSAWVNPSISGTTESRFLSKASSTHPEQHFIMTGQYHDGSLRFRLRTNNETTTLITKPDLLQLNQWSFITFTYDLRSMKIYHNGVLANQHEKTGVMNRSASVAMAIGNQPNGAGERPFTGLMDDVRLYNRALSDNEIIQLMAYRPSDCIKSSEPLNLSATINGGVVKLAWDEPLQKGAGISHYELLRDTTLIAILPSELTYSDAGLDPQTAYDYTVRAVGLDSNASALSSPLTVITSAPDQITDSTPDSYHLKLSWTTTNTTNPFSTQDSEYEIWHNNKFVGFAMTEEYLFSLSDNPALASGCFKIRAVAGDKASEFSEQGCYQVGG